MYRRDPGSFEWSLEVYVKGVGRIPITHKGCPRGDNVANAVVKPTRCRCVRSLLLPPDSETLEQKMGNLPECRLEVGMVFRNTGVDNAC